MIFFSRHLLNEEKSVIIYHETVGHDRNSSLGPIVLPGENRAVFVYILLKKKK